MEQQTVVMFPTWIVCADISGCFVPGTGYLKIPGDPISAQTALTNFSPSNKHKLADDFSRHTAMVV